MNKDRESNITLESYQRKEAVDVYDSEVLKWSERYIFNNYFSRPGVILDLGCGVGRTSYFLKQLGHKVVAIDYSNAMIERARIKYRNSGIIFELMSADDLRYPDNTFDYAFFSLSLGLSEVWPLNYIFWQPKGYASPVGVC